MSKRSRSASIIVGSWIAFYGCAHTQVRPDDLSAEGHRLESERERAAAYDHYARYDPIPTEPPPGVRGSQLGVPYLFPIEIYPFSSTAVHLRAAERHLQHAVEHEKAATALESFEEAECRDFPPKTRAACPILGPVVRVESLPDGVRIQLETGTLVDAVVAHMRCHLAFARVRGFESAAACPLYLKGVEIMKAADGRAVEIRSHTPSVVTEIRAQVATIVH